MDTNNQTLPYLLDVQQVADLLNASTRHIYRLVEAGKMPQPVRLGTLCRWSRRIIEQWIEDGCPALQHGVAAAQQRQKNKACCEANPPEPNHWRNQQ